MLQIYTSINSVHIAIGNHFSVRHFASTEPTRNRKRSFPWNIRACNILLFVNMRQIFAYVTVFLQLSNWYRNQLYLQLIVDQFYRFLCAGSSSWIDVTNPEIRKWWSSQFAFDKYKVQSSDGKLWPTQDATHSIYWVACFQAVAKMKFFDKTKKLLQFPLNLTSKFYFYSMLKVCKVVQPYLNASIKCNCHIYDHTSGKQRLARIIGST